MLLQQQKCTLLCCQASAHLLGGGTGDGAGVLHIMDLPRNLRRRVPSEVNTMQAFLMRQLARLDYLQACKPRRAQLLKVTPMHTLCALSHVVCLSVRSSLLSVHMPASHPSHTYQAAFGHYSCTQLPILPSSTTHKLANKRHEGAAWDAYMLCYRKSTVIPCLGMY